MNSHEQPLNATPQFSIVIPVYNDWNSLERCLRSLAGQANYPGFEVIVVDDGSADPSGSAVPYTGFPFTLTFVRQDHRGIPSARNLGTRHAKGDVVLFVDADCRLDANCLAALDSAVTRAPQHDCFQLRLVGNRSSLVGRAEELRLATFQQLMLQADGRIRYLNTAGFAIRRTRIGAGEIFHPEALRAEDTLLLAKLMQEGELPLFVPEAIVEHDISLSFLGCLKKDMRSVYLEGAAYDMIESKGVRIRVTHRDRLRLLGSMWKVAREDSLGQSAWFVVVIRQAFQRIASFAYRYLRMGSGAFSRQF
jgi:glycosyltransferase involved in cell wall biosynthesis